jgi:hypothetical protein
VIRNRSVEPYQSRGEPQRARGYQEGRSCSRRTRDGMLRATTSEIPCLTSLSLAFGSAPGPAGCQSIRAPDGSGSTTPSRPERAWVLWVGETG